MKIFQTFTFILVANFVYAQSSDLILQGVLDLDLPTGAFTGKATHLVATNSISDLSIYGLGTASNGGGSDSVELTLPAISVNAGDDILLARDTNAIHLYFGSCFNSFEIIIPVLTTGAAAVSQTEVLLAAGCRSRSPVRTGAVSYTHLTLPTIALV